MNTFTEAQEQAFNQVKRILSEHFECFTLAVETDLQDQDEEGEELTFWRGAFDGGDSRALGLSLKHVDRMRGIRPDIPA